MLALPTHKLGILLSGRGSNFLAIAESIRTGKLKGAEIAVVISNVADAAGLSAAERLGLPHAVFESKGRKREDHDADVIASSIRVDAHGSTFRWRWDALGLDRQVSIPLLGRHQVANVSAALAAVLYRAG